MPNTRAAGNDGAVTTPTGTHDAALSAWNLSFVPAFGNVSAFADVCVRNRAGVADVTGSATGVPTYDAASTSPLGGAGSSLAAGDFPDAGSAWTFTMATACSVAATMVCSVNLSSDFNANQAGVGFDFRHGDSATFPVMTWDETG